MRWLEPLLLVQMQPVPLPGGQEGFSLKLPLSLTCDHWVVNGGPAARFLGDLVARIAACDATWASAA
jgi:pyruvate/2-oxoglutarate dehydrogenase complex dihydrolipoamide acyltransferase (E2) component